MISRDFFSVANNLGDSVACNLESDTTPHRLSVVFERFKWRLVTRVLGLFLLDVAAKTSSLTMNRPLKQCLRGGSSCTNSSLVSSLWLGYPYTARFQIATNGAFTVRRMAVRETCLFTIETTAMASSLTSLRIETAFRRTSISPLET